MNRLKRSRVFRWLRVGALALLATILPVAAVAGSIWWYLHPAHTRTDGVVYGRRQGTDLALDVTLVVRRGAGHGWLTMVWDIRRFARWFDKQLKGKS